jgi:hypothetical protein
LSDCLIWTGAQHKESEANAMMSILLAALFGVALA